MVPSSGWARENRTELETSVAETHHSRGSAGRVLKEGDVELEGEGIQAMKVMLGGQKTSPRWMGVRFERGTGVEFIRVGERRRARTKDIIFSGDC